MKGRLLIHALALLILTSVGLLAAENPAALERRKELSKLESLLTTLKQGRSGMAEIEKKATQYLKGNLVKSLLKGVADIVEVGTGTRSAMNLITKKAGDVVLEDKKWGHATKESVLSANLGSEAMDRYERLSSMYKVMNEILAEKNPERFDSDSPPYKYTQYWWPSPDNKKDSKIQQVFRRTYIIHEFSKKILEVTDREIATVKAEIGRISTAQPPPETKPITKAQPLPEAKRIPKAQAAPKTKSISKVQPEPSTEDVFEDTFVHKFIQLNVRVTNVDLQGQKEEVSPDPGASRKIKSLFFSTSASSVNVTLRYRIDLTGSSAPRYSPNGWGTITYQGWRGKEETWLSLDTQRGPMLITNQISKRIPIGKEDEPTTIHCDFHGSIFPDNTGRGDLSELIFRIFIYPSSKAERFRSWYENKK